MRAPGPASRVRTTLAALALLPGLAACGDGPAGDGDRAFTVLAAASLAEAFTGLAPGFEAEHPGVEVEFRFESSTELAASAADAAPGDVLAVADQVSMRLAENAGVTAARPVPFATNVLVLVTPAGNPAEVASPGDLAGTTWVRCADDVPCGRAALALLERAAVTAAPASLEPDVRTALERVRSGEADAGLVYASDAVAAGDDVETIPVPGAAAAPTTYLIAPLTQSEDAGLAADWVRLATSGAGRQALREAGFGVP